MAKKYSRIRICFNCGKEFIGYPGKPKGKRTFCGNDCRLEWLGKKNLTSRVNQKGGLTLEERNKIRESRLGKGEGKSYPKYFGRHEHRIVAELKLGRPLKPGEIVHHIDGDKRNNRPENLLILKNQSEHIKLHLTQGGGYL